MDRARLTAVCASAAEIAYAVINRAGEDYLGLRKLGQPFIQLGDFDIDRIPFLSRFRLHRGVNQLRALCPHLGQLSATAPRLLGLPGHLRYLRVKLNHLLAGVFRSVPFNDSFALGEFALAAIEQVEAFGQRRIKKVFFIRPVERREDRLQSVIVLLRNRVEFVVVALRAVDGDAGKGPHGIRHHVVAVEVPRNLAVGLGFG